MKKIHMLADRLLVQRLEAEEKTKAGIIIPETAKEEQTKGKVIAVGSGKRLSSGKIQAPEVEKEETPEAKPCVRHVGLRRHVRTVRVNGCQS